MQLQWRTNRKSYVVLVVTSVGIAKKEVLER